MNEIVTLLMDDITCNGGAAAGIFIIYLYFIL